MPSDTCNGSFDAVRIFEYHESFSGYILIDMLGCFTREILFKEIDFVILSDAFSDTLAHFLGGLRETKSGVSVHLFGILSLISWLSWIDMSRPTTFLMLHTLSSDRYSLGVHAMLRQLWNV